jgi:hypothetical protein
MLRAGPRLVGVAASLALAGALAACSGGATVPTASPTTAYPRLTPTCPAPTGTASPPVTVAELNRVVAGLDLPLWQAGDIGASARLPDQRIVWVFGDTVRSSRVFPRVVANSMLVSSGLCASQVETRDRGPVIPDRADGVVHWPMSVGVVRDGRQTGLLVVSGRIRRGTGGPFDFTYLGSTATVFALPAEASDGAPELAYQLDLTPDSTDGAQVNWGSAMTVQDGWIYLYGTRLPTRTSYGRALYVARAPEAQARDRSTWRFWDGRAWVPDYVQARQILPARGGVSQTLSVDVVGGRFVIVSKRDGDLGDTVYAWTSTSPTGPWTATRGVRAAFRERGGALQYAPLAHPSIELESGKLLISISRNTTDFARLLSQPTLGRPVFAEIDRP